MKLNESSGLARSYGGRGVCVSNELKNNVESEKLIFALV